MELNHRLKAGTLLYFSPFWFPDGGQPKPKYFVVLYNEDKDMLLASLPTSKDHIPSDIEMQAGCIGFLNTKRLENV